MPVGILVETASGLKVILGGGTPPVRSPFVEGQTMPLYTVTSDFSGSKNIGNLSGVSQSSYVGSGDGSSVQLGDGTYNDIDFGNRMLDMRGNITFNNCRGVLLPTNTSALSGHITILNGSGTGLVTMNNCEFHSRAQHIIGASVFGRNFVIHKSVFTGAVDGIDNASTGSAPLNSGGEIYDSWIGDLAWWRATAGGIVHPSDTQTHNDVRQIAWDHVTKSVNTFHAAWPSEFVGTGTPGAGSDAGNPSTAAYIYDQATQNGYRATYLNKISRADQSFGGVPRKSSTGGSWSGIMLNKAAAATPLVSLHDYFSGGTVGVNAVDAGLSGSVGSIKQGTFWNDMSSGHDQTTTNKGTAIYIRAALTYDIPTTGSDENLWFDASVVTPSTI